MDTHANVEADAADLPLPDSVAAPVPEPLSPSVGRPQYSISAVSKLTGISCHTLRVWERRYGFPVPYRSPAGHRRYERSQVQTLWHLSQLARGGHHTIGALIAQHRSGSLEPEARHAALPGPAVASAVPPLIRLLLAGDNHGAEREFARLASTRDPLSLAEQVIAPALVEAGEGWFRRSYMVYQERLITVFLRAKLARLIEEARSANGQAKLSVIVGTVQGDRHEGGVMMFNLVMELRGWRVHNLGGDLPVPEFLAAVHDLNASALALSFVLSRNIKKRFQELESLTTTPVFVGGRSIVNYQSLARQHGLIPLPGPIGKTTEQFLTEFRRWKRRHPVADAQEATQDRVGHRS